MCPKYRPIKDNKSELLQSRLFNHIGLNIMAWLIIDIYIIWVINIVMITLLALFMICDLIEIVLQIHSIFSFIHSFIHSFILSFIYIHLSFSFVIEVCVSNIFTARVCAAIMTCLLFSLILFVCSVFFVLFCFSLFCFVFCFCFVFYSLMVKLKILCYSRRWWTWLQNTLWMKF